MGSNDLIELFKNVWVNNQCVSAFWVNELTTESTSFFLRRKGTKVTGYRFTIVFVGNSVPLEYGVLTKAERDKVVELLNGM
jgi:hypothetical protein